VIDIHTHLLPGVDDGSPTAAHSAVVLQRMVSEGVSGVVCTPHLNASQAHKAPYDEYRALLDDLRAMAPLSLGGSTARLVEFPRRHLPTGATEELLRLRMSGIVPVVAHPERYRGCTLDVLHAWRELGAVLQGDAMALLGAGPMTELARAMLAEGLTDILASDNHGDRRALSTARRWLEEIHAGQQADVMTRENPRRLLENRALAPVPPIRLQTGVFERLKTLLFGRSRRAAGQA